MVENKAAHALRRFPLGRLAGCSILPQFLGIAPAIEIKSIIEMPLPADCFMIVVAVSSSQPLEAFGDRLETRGLRREIGSPGIGAAHNERHSVDRLVLYPMLLDDRVERAFLTVMTELCTGC